MGQGGFVLGFHSKSGLESSVTPFLICCLLWKEWLTHRTQRCCRGQVCSSGRRSHSGQAAPPACTSATGGGELATGPVHSPAIAEALSFPVGGDHRGETEPSLPWSFLFSVCALVPVRWTQSWFVLDGWEYGIGQGRIYIWRGRQ